MEGVNVFRLTEKRFQGKTGSGEGQQKRRRKRKEAQPTEEPTLPWEEVIDFHNLEANSHSNRSLIIEQDVHPDADNLAPRMTKIYTLADAPGFAFIPNPFTFDEQLHWADRCVREYVEAPPGITNLAAHHPATDLTHLFSHAFPGASSSPPPATSTSTAAPTSEGQNQAKAEQALLWKLRWTTLGYHYDWTNRKYHEHHRDEFPADLARLCEHFAAAAGMRLACQAAIVNYYAPETVLCGHLDDVELTFEAPIVSISLGLSAIFLLGGRTREEKPRAMLLRSGDVVVMGGASRLLYHGVPRILPATLPPELAHHRLAGTEPHLAHVVDYLSKRRININARQVLPTGCDFPSTAASPEKGELAC